MYFCTHVVQRLSRSSSRSRPNVVQNYSTHMLSGSRPNCVPTSCKTNNRQLLMESPLIDFKRLPTSLPTYVQSRRQAPRLVEWGSPDSVPKAIWIKSEHCPQVINRLHKRVAKTVFHMWSGKHCNVAQTLSTSGQRIARTIIRTPFTYCQTVSQT